MFLQKAIEVSWMIEPFRPVSLSTHAAQLKFHVFMTFADLDQISCFDFWLLLQLSPSIHRCEYKPSMEHTFSLP